MTPQRSAISVGTLLLLAAVPLTAQTTYPNVKLTGRLHEQFYFFDNDNYAATAGSKANFFTRRARIEARGQISENVTVYIQPSFEGGRNLSGVTTTCTSTAVPVGGGTPALTCRTAGRSGLRLRDAWIDVRFSPEAAKGALYLRAGQEKRPYSRYELTSSNNLPSIERGGGQGLLARQSNDLFGGNGFLAHDVGASVRYEYKLDDVRLVTLKVGAYNGQGESLTDLNNKKSIGARATAAKNKMRGIQGLAAYNYRFKSPTSWLYAVEPAFRVDVADPNTRVEDDRSTLITAVLGLYMSSKAQLRVAYERQSFQGDVTPAISGIRSALTVNF